MNRVRLEENNTRKRMKCVRDRCYLTCEKELVGRKKKNNKCKREEKRTI